MAVVSPRLIAAMREQLGARERMLQSGATHVGWRLGMGDRESIDVEAYVELAGNRPDAIGGYGVALELVDLTPQEGEPGSIVATNVFHRAVSFGSTTPQEPRGVQVGMRLNGEPQETGVWPADISSRLPAASEVLEAVGSSLRAGDRIITGSIVQVRISAGDSIAALIDGEAAVTLDVV
jgi:hypothetical protein